MTLDPPGPANVGERNKDDAARGSRLLNRTIVALSGYGTVFSKKRSKFAPMGNRRCSTVAPINRIRHEER